MPPSELRILQSQLDRIEKGNLVDTWPTPRLTMTDPPAEGQRCLYFFSPSGHWFVGEWDGGSHFTGRHGFCDWHDAPFWLPEPPNALDMIEAAARRECYTESASDPLGPRVTESSGVTDRADMLMLLAEHGRFRVAGECGRMVFGYWPENDPERKEGGAG